MKLEHKKNRAFLKVEKGDYLLLNNLHIGKNCTLKTKYPIIMIKKPKHLKQILKKLSEEIK